MSGRGTLPATRDALPSTKETDNAEMNRVAAYVAADFTSIVQGYRDPRLNPQQQQIFNQRMFDYIGVSPVALPEISDSTPRSQPTTLERAALQAVLTIRSQRVVETQSKLLEECMIPSTDIDPILHRFAAYLDLAAQESGRTFNPGNGSKQYYTVNGIIQLANVGADMHRRRIDPLSPPGAHCSVAPMPSSRERN